MITAGIHEDDYNLTFSDPPKKGKKKKKAILLDEFSEDDSKNRASKRVITK